MGIFDGILGAVAPVIGSIFGGPAGGAIGSAVGSIFSDMGVSGTEDYSKYGSELGSKVGGALGTGVASGITADRAEDSVRQTNEYNLALAREGQAFSAAQADKQMAFQEAKAREAMNWSGIQNEAAMQFGASQASINRDFQQRNADTAYQRATKDMAAAGLNPMLAYSQGGATTPQGSVAAGHAGTGSAPGGARSDAIVPSMANAKLAAINTAMAAETMMVNLDKSRAEAAESRSRAEVNMASIPKIAQDIKTSVSSAGHLDAETKRVLDVVEKLHPEQQMLLRQEMRQNWTLADWNIIRGNTELEYGRPLMREHYGLTKAEKEHSQLGLRLSRNQEEAQKSWWMRSVSPYLPDFLKGSSSAYGFSRAFGR